ncbi:MAG TPA: glycerol-3-phosphate 1-O-acyltransferase [Solirubrobacteraceae bacterium]|nr:glycerol-3-phosphate 1-O-acyltransferase [Solirubrobacteraceae bacterium]
MTQVTHRVGLAPDGSRADPLGSTPGSEAPSSSSSSPPSRRSDVVLVTQARSATERELIHAWAQREHPGAVSVPLKDPDLVGRLAALGDPEVIPVRVTWVPPERDGDRQVRLIDVLALTNPRRPPARLQPWIAEHQPDRVHVVAGEGARLSALRVRFRQHSGSANGHQGLAAFIAAQAVIALDRADRAIIGDRYKVPRLVAEQITASGAFRAEVARLADRQGRSLESVMAEATSDLRELATVQSPLAIDVFRMLLSPMHRRAYDVEADLEGLERLRELNRRHALVFLPSHRSYTDPLVLAEVLHANDFPRNHLLGGNNLAFWPIGPLGKRAGLIFIRRSFGDDPVYKLAVREFLAHLVAKRFNIEWYIEGGRTRTGKLRPPKYGLLHYLATAVEQGRTEDVMLVPVSINYSRLHEVSAMVEEQRGQRKRAEGLGWLAGYMRAQQKLVGSVRIDFGEAFSLVEALAEAGEGRARLEKVAFRICDGINAATPVSPPSLLTLALLGSPQRALTLEQVALILDPAIGYVRERGIPGDVEDLLQPARLRAALDRLVAAGVVTCYAGGTEPVWSVAPGNHMVAAFYRNGVLHHFIIRAIVELAILAAADHPGEDVDRLQVAEDEAMRIRDLLKFEFFFADKARFRTQLLEELDRIDPHWRDRARTSAEARALLAGSGLLVANRALRSFLDAQLVVADRLAATPPRQAIDREAFLEDCLGVGRQMLLQGRLHSAESVSRELFGSALALAANRDLVDPGREPVTAARQAFLAEIVALVALVEQVRVLDERAVEAALDA